MNETASSPLSEASLSEIAPGRIFVGTVMAARNKDALKRKGITHIVSCVGEAEVLFRTDFEYLVLDFHDRPSTDLAEPIERAREFMSQGSHNGNTLFVYCGSGVSRAPALVLGYLMTGEHLAFEQAWTLVHQARPYVNPNQGFMDQLKRMGTAKD